MYMPVRAIAQHSTHLVEAVSSASTSSCPGASESFSCLHLSSQLMSSELQMAATAPGFSGVGLCYGNDTQVIRLMQLGLSPEPSSWPKSYIIFKILNI